MERAGRVVALVVALALTVALQPVGAAAQTPAPEATPSPQPSPSPSPSATASPSPSPTASPSPSPSPTASNPPAPPGEGNTGGGPKGGDTPGDDDAPRPDRPKADERGRRRPRRPGFYHPQGAFDTDRLVALAVELRALGWSRRRIIARVYPPFIIAGPAAWTNTWGAPRYGPAPGQLRTHEGQDVFCEYGDPVLASEGGTVEFADGGLGGKVARLHRDAGGYWYYAHLADWNTRELRSGARVDVGDVIGYCGNSGNAAGTSPHVHLGLYGADGIARDPMRHLVAWLRTAHRRAFGELDRTQFKRLRDIDAVTAQRRFGDAFVPDLSDLDISGESLWASGTNPASAAFALAESALRSALADRAMSPPPPTSVSLLQGDAAHVREPLARAWLHVFERAPTSARTRAP